MNTQKSLAEKYAENQRWLETECRKLGLEERNKVAGDTTKQSEAHLASNRRFISKQSSQRS